VQPGISQKFEDVIAGLETALATTSFPIPLSPEESDFRPLQYRSLVLTLFGPASILSADDDLEPPAFFEACPFTGPVALIHRLKPMNHAMDSAIPRGLRHEVSERYERFLSNAQA